MGEPVTEAAFALFDAHRSGVAKLSRSAGQFVGQFAVDPQPMTEKQADWFGKLLSRAGLPQLNEWEAAHG